MALVGSGVISQEEARQMLANDENLDFSHLDVENVPEVIDYEGGV